jgi:hypothetical protein
MRPKQFVLVGVACLAAANDDLSSYALTDVS